MSQTLKLTDDYNFLFENNNLVLATGTDALIDRLKTNLKLYKGDWYLDTNLGVPYIEKVFKKQTNVGALYSIFGNIILGTEGVKSINKLQFDQDKETRKLIVTFNITSDEGVQLEDSATIGG